MLDNEEPCNLSRFVLSNGGYIWLKIDDQTANHYSLIFYHTQVTKPFGRTVKLLRKVKNLRSGSTMNRWLVSFGHGLGSGAFDRRELPDMEMEEDCFRKLVSSEVFAPKSAQMRRSTSDEQKASTAVAAAAATEKSSLGKAVEDSLTQEAKVEQVAVASVEPAAETAVAVADPIAPPPPEQQQQHLKLPDDSAESSPRIEHAHDNNGGSHKRKVSHGSSTSSPLDGSDPQQPPAKKLCPALKSEEEPPMKANVMDEERMDASTAERDEQQIQPQPPVEAPASAPPAPSSPAKEEEIKEERKEEVQVTAEVETKVEVDEAPAGQKPETLIVPPTMAEPKVEEVETKVEMDVERTPDLKSVPSEEAKETENGGHDEEQNPPIPVTEEIPTAPSPPPVKEELPVNVAMEEEEVTAEDKEPPVDVAMMEEEKEATVEEKAPAEAETAPQTSPEPEPIDLNPAKEEEGTVSIKRKRSNSGEISSSSNKISEEEQAMVEQPMQSTTDSSPKAPSPPPSPKAASPPPTPPPPKSPSPPPQPRAPTPPPMLLAHDLLAKAKLAKKLSQKPISLQQLKQQARAKLIEKNIHQGKGGKKQKRKGERKSRRYQKAPPPKPQTSEAEVSTNSSEDAEENVEKIVMNTGTLYLYRGENPRAEFIRRK